MAVAMNWKRVIFGYFIFLVEGEDEPEDPFAESSRGLWLIRVLMDEISYETDSGINRLVLTKRMA